MICVCGCLLPLREKYKRNFDFYGMLQFGMSPVPFVLSCFAELLCSF